MSNVPLAERKLKVATPLEPGGWPSDRGASPAGAAFAPRLKEDPPVAKNGEPLDISIHVDDLYTSRAWLGRHGLTASIACFAQLAVEEAPAWLISMVVHMVTLVTMAMITVSEPVPYKPQHLIVTPPEKKKVEKPLEVEDDKPKTLDDTSIAELVTMDTHADQSEKYVEPSRHLEAAASASPVPDAGLKHIPQGEDILALSNGYGNNPIGIRNEVAMDPKKALDLGATTSSEIAVSKALKWLATHQLTDGSWSFDTSLAPSCKGKCRNSGSLSQARNAATGLALMAFLGTGQTHQRSENYQVTIHRGLQFLINNMRVGGNGGALDESGGMMYSHGIAAIAISEAYALTNDPNLLTPTRAVLGYICYAQDPIGGGWRYRPRQKGDTSVVGWQIMALKSGHMAGFEIPPLVVERASQFLDEVQQSGGSAYGYTTPGQGEATTAIGLLCRMYLGWQHDNPALERGVRMLSKRGPSPSNMYYNYYATQVMRHWEGEPWENWNRQMRDQLVHSQAKQGHEEGSWFTGSGDLGAPTGGRLYCTAMATMILEVYYRHLPIYRSDSIEQEFPD
ncbi:MAG: terpene cyclase/mutase family protein [Pirellulaceae bacterium]|nr:terpene cyclase/mutase family protein [Pirellulaceae bacterium]